MASPSEYRLALTTVRDGKNFAIVADADFNGDWNAHKELKEKLDSWVAEEERK
jgi:hypothetical protein